MKSGPKPRPASERFWEKVDKTDGCWLWTGRKHSLGYGLFFLWPGRRRVQAHRFAYMEMHGSVPTGLELDHLCRNPSCVNPAHLEAVTHKVNMLRGISPTAVNAAKTICKRGHPLDLFNTYVSPVGYRHCRTCSKEHEARRTDRHDVCTCGRRKRSIARLCKSCAAKAMWQNRRAAA